MCISTYRQLADISTAAESHLVDRVQYRMWIFYFIWLFTSSHDVKRGTAHFTLFSHGISHYFHITTMWKSRWIIHTYFTLSSHVLPMVFSSSVSGLFFPVSFINSQLLGVVLERHDSLPMFLTKFTENMSRPLSQLIDG